MARRSCGGIPPIPLDKGGEESPPAPFDKGGEGPPALLDKGEKKTVALDKGEESPPAPLDKGGEEAPALLDKGGEEDGRP